MITDIRDWRFLVESTDGGWQALAGYFPDAESPGQYSFREFGTTPVSAIIQCEIEVRKFIRKLQ